MGVVHQTMLDIDNFVIISKIVIRMNLLSNMDEIADLIIRPSRYIYKAGDLGPKIISS